MIFNWERAYGDTYPIVYCESRDVVEGTYNVMEVEYDLNSCVRVGTGLG